MLFMAVYILCIIEVMRHDLYFFERTKHGAMVIEAGSI